ncbi:MAG TPA: hypothetical protein VIL48_07015 [Acidimicrobiales bacterium]
MRLRRENGYKRLTIDMAPGLYDELQSLADDAGISVSEYLRRAVALARWAGVGEDGRIGHRFVGFKVTPYVYDELQRRADDAGLTLDGFMNRTVENALEGGPLLANGDDAD